MTLCSQPPARQKMKLNRTLPISVSIFYMFIRGSCSFQKMPLPISLTFIHLLEDTGNGTTRFNYLRQSLLLTSVGSDNFEKTYHNAKKDILSLKKRDIIIDVISSDSMQN